MLFCFFLQTSACHIDSITESNIYFMMKVKGDWTHTRINLDLASNYERNVIEKKQYLFEPGTSIIKSVYPRELPRNSVYAGLGDLNYARTFLGNPYGITLGVGVIYTGYSPGYILESTLLVGGSNHWFEPGILVYYLSYNSVLGIAIRMGYRYQGPRGFLFRVAPLVAYDDGGFRVLPNLALGYSF